MENEIDVSKEVESLVKKAEQSQEPLAALQFSQAACNAANAMACLSNIPKPKPKPTATPAA
jgi:hypothetical protein